MDLNEVLIFVRVVQAGNFNKAAQILGMPNSTVSTKVSALEKRLGVNLLHRTTRKLRLTEAGEVFFATANNSVDALVAAEQAAATGQGEPQGQLRITAPVLVASSILPEVISAFIEKYPGVRFELIASDHTTDLLSENIDLAIRAGKLPDSSMKAKKIGATYFALFASPSYLATHLSNQSKKNGLPLKHPKDLIHHVCIQFTPLGESQWDFVNSAKSRIKISMNKRILLNDLNTTKEMAVLGKGIALLPTFLCEKELSTKQLTRVLPEWHSEPREMSFVYPSHKYMPPKISAFISLASEMIKKRLIQAQP